MRLRKETSYPSVFNLTRSDKIWIEDTIESLSLEEKCAQLVMPWVLGNFLNDESEDYKRLEKLVKDLKVGGLIFFSGDILNQAILTNKMQALANIPLLIAADFERGLGMRLRDGLEYPYAMALAATRDLTLTYKLGKAIAEEAKAIGVHHNYAPVADLSDNPFNPIVNIRAFSEDKKIAASFCDAFIKGTASAKVLATAKHFPGHGNTHIDSHIDLPIIKGSAKYLSANELIPFSNSIKAGVHSIMVGHLGVPSLESDLKLTATLSKKIITNLLIKKMRFEGLIVTDAMNMDSVCKNFSAADAAVKAFDAGNDLILFPPDEEIAVDALYTAVKKNKITYTRLNHSLRKLLAAKKWVNIDENRFVELNEIAKKISTKKHIALAEKIAEKSITLVKNNKKIIPINKARQNKFFWITLTEGLGNESELHFQELLQKYFPNSMKALVHNQTNEDYYTDILTTVKQVDLIIISSFVRVKAYQGIVSLSNKHKTFIGKITNGKIPSILISFGNPYILSQFPKADVYLCGYGDTKVTQIAMLKALLGEIDIIGKLPVSIPNTKYRIGDGIKILKRNSKN